MEKKHLGSSLLLTSLQFLHRLHENGEVSYITLTERADDPVTLLGPN